MTPEEIAIRADALMSEAQKTYRDAARLERLGRGWFEARDHIEAVERERDEARAILRTLLDGLTSLSGTVRASAIRAAHAAVKRWESET